MGLKACVSVHQCDGCEELIILRSPDQYEAFYEKWFNDLLVDFCPKCRSTPKAQAAIDRAMAENRAIDAVIAKYRPAPEVEYVN